MGDSFENAAVESAAIDAALAVAETDAATAVNRKKIRSRRSINDDPSIQSIDFSLLVA